MDDPPHHHLRNLVNKGFTPRMISQLAPKVRALISEILDRIAARGECDLVRDCRVPLALFIIADMLAGRPAADARGRRIARVVRGL